MLAHAMSILVHAILIGLIATALVDLWALARLRISGVAPPNFRLVGRWFAYLPRGRFKHDSIAASPPLPYEHAIGWLMHYVVGIAFAGILLAIAGIDWARHPTIVPALIVGIGTVVSPFFIMQPGMGMGIAASRTPDPWAARRRSLVAHTAFGLALYAGGWIASLIAP
jgi:hypothetical protein